MDRFLKIDYICIGYWPIFGGTETVVRKIAEIMAKRGHDITVHTSFYNPNYKGELKASETFNGVKIKRHKLFPLYIFFPKIKNPQIVHLFSYGDNFMIQAILNGSEFLVGSPIGEEIYASHKIRNKILGKFVLKRFRKIFAMTFYEKKVLMKDYEIREDKIIVWPAGVDEVAFSAPDINNVHDEILKTSGTRYFVRLARIDRVKFIEFGINILPLFPQLTYLVIGPFDDNNYLNELRQLACKLGVEGRVIFTGRVNEDEKRFLLRGALFYLISNHETFGAATVEAMAQSVPIIGPNLEEYKDLLTDQVNALIYEYGSISSCANVVEKIIQNETLRLELGKEGKIIAREKFSWDKIADVAENIYRSF